MFTTMGENGQPQSSLMWVNVEGGCTRVNTTLERQNGRTSLANSKVSLLVVDRSNTASYTNIRGDAELVTDGALEYLDVLTGNYTHHHASHGYFHPGGAALAAGPGSSVGSTPQFTLDAIHS